MPQSPSPSAASAAPNPYDPLEVLSVSLTAPDPQVLTAAEIAERVHDLYSAAERRRHDACRDLVARLAPLAAAGPDDLIDAARLCHTEPDALAEDIYALRAFAGDPKSAAAVAEMRRYLEEAFVPESERELALDRAIADGQVSFGVLIADRERVRKDQRERVSERAVAEGKVPYGVFVADPRRMRTAELAFNHFRGVYVRRYEDFHAAYWTAASQLNARLQEAGRDVRALRRLNSLVELGPPAGEDAIGEYEELLAATTACAPRRDLSEVLKEVTVCPGCSLRLGTAGHGDAVDAVLRGLSQSIEMQLSRLSSMAVRAILERSNDPRVERFLNVVQAAQITTLTEILDDDLVGYLRRFLLEARISTLLDPILDHVQAGGDDDESAMREALGQLADVLHRAIRGTAQSPGDDVPAG